MSSVLVGLGALLIFYASILLVFGPIMYHDERSRLVFVMKNFYNYKWVILMYTVGTILFTIGIQ